LEPEPKSWTKEQSQSQRAEKKIRATPIERAKLQNKEPKEVDESWQFGSQLCSRCGT